MGQQDLTCISICFITVLSPRLSPRLSKQGLMEERMFACMYFVFWVQSRNLCIFPGNMLSNNNNKPSVTIGFILHRDGVIYYYIPVHGQHSITVFSQGMQ